jgi:hypothetical protein
VRREHLTPAIAATLARRCVSPAFSAARGRPWRGAFGAIRRLRRGARLNALAASDGAARSTDAILDRLPRPHGAGHLTGGRDRRRVRRRPRDRRQRRRGGADRARARRSAARGVRERRRPDPPIYRWQGAVEDAPSISSS